VQVRAPEGAVHRPRCFHVWIGSTDEALAVRNAAVAVRSTVILRIGSAPFRSIWARMLFGASRTIVVRTATRSASWAAVHRLPLYEAALHLAKAFEIPPEQGGGTRYRSSLSLTETRAVQASTKPSARSGARHEAGPAAGAGFRHWRPSAWRQCPPWSPGSSATATVIRLDGT
jgi:hypothetical protein